MRASYAVAAALCTACFLMSIAVLPATVWAQDEAATQRDAGIADQAPETSAAPSPEAELEAEAELNSGDNAWLLTSSALVLMMTAPGLAMFYSGLVRRKNVLGVMMQCMFLMGLMTVVW